MIQIVDITDLELVNLDAAALSYRTAKLSEFRASVPKLLFGKHLKDITDIEASIAQQGLMRPLKVTQSGDKLVVIDGRKRLCALRRMRFKNTLPRSLINIPFVMSTETVPHVLSAQDQYTVFLNMKSKGHSDEAITASLCINSARLHALQSIERLSPRLKTAFLNKAVNLEQAHAFAALGWHKEQDMALMSVGPFASATTILKVIKERKARLKTPDQTKICSELISMQAPPLKGLTPTAYKQRALIAA